jgi:hypothetical protein
MTGSTVPIAPIPLARSTGRLLTPPSILLLAGGVAVAGGVQLGDLTGIGLVAAGLVVVALSIALATMLLSVRLDVEIATLRLRWLGGERRYTLVRGPVTRVALRGGEAARLQPRFGALGWALGRARLRGNEIVDVVRLSPSASMILVPTDRGRVGVAPASEQQLLAALAAAARIQQRLDEVAGRARAFTAPGQEEHAAAIVRAPEPPAIALPISTPSEEAPAAMRRLLTGIERTLLEERLAADRAAALLAAEAERRAATDAARMVSFIPEAPIGGAAPVTARVRVRRRGQWQRPAWMARRELRRPVALERRPFPVPRDRLLAYGLVVTPAVVAGAVWLAAAVNGRLDMPVEQLRPVAVALLAAGPAGALAGLAAQTWFPRLVGLVAITALAALGLIGRGLLV